MELQQATYRTEGKGSEFVEDPYTEMVMEQASIFIDICPLLEKIERSPVLVLQNGHLVREYTGKIVANFQKICETGKYTMGDSRKPDEVFKLLWHANEKIGKCGNLPFIDIDKEWDQFDAVRKEANEKYGKKSKTVYDMHEQMFWSLPQSLKLPSL